MCLFGGQILVGYMNGRPSETSVNSTELHGVTFKKGGLLLRRVPNRSLNTNYHTPGEHNLHFQSHFSFANSILMQTS
jgi:hypothetical protein